MSRKEQGVMLTTFSLEQILTHTDLPNHTEQLNNFIEWMATVQPKYGATVDLISYNVIAAVGAEDYNSLAFVVDHCIELGLVIGNRGAGNLHLVQYTDFKLTYAGWSRYDEIQLGSTASRNAFMAMQYNDEQIDKLYKKYLKTAVSACGFNLKRLDEGQPAGLIDDRLRLEIRQCRFLIADLTNHNRGAYWEAGYAEGLGKQVIYICRKDVFDNKTHGTHFDTNHHLNVVWEPGKEAEAMDKLKNTIRATLPSEAKLAD